MNSYRMIAILFVVSLAGLLLAPSARADEWHKTTRVTVNEPIEVPGRVLMPGTYTFRLVSPDNDIVQIWNANQTHLYASIMTIPDHCSQPTGHTVLELKESSKGAPPELHAWFYPGDLEGEEFVYLNSPAAVVGKTKLESVKPVA